MGYLRQLRKRHKLGQAGDTIVEVLIVLAILGLAMSVSYATATRGLQQSRNAQEHSEALGIISSQIELLRSAFAKQAGSTVESQAASGPFCLSTPTPPAVVNITALANSGTNAFDENLATDKLGNTTTYPGPCIQNSLYNISIVGRGGGVYDIRVRWEGLGQLGRQQEELTYKMGNVVITPTSGYTDAQSPPPPAIPLTMSFSASVGTVNRGTPFTLTWSTSPAAETCTASGAWSGAQTPSGSTSVSSTSGNPSVSYTLTCTLATQSVSQTVTVNLTNPQNLSPLYRSFQYSVYDHFYSVDASEGVSCCGYTPEGNVGKVDLNQVGSEIPLYRLYNGGITDHFYTTSQDESNLAAAGYGYTYEGIVGYVMPYTGSCPAGTSPLYRMYSSALTDHFYTTNFSEYASATDANWSHFLGGHIAWYNYPEGIIGCTFN